MKSDLLTGLPDQQVLRLDPLRMQEYLRLAGWIHEPRLGKGKTGVYEHPGTRLAQLRVPLTRELQDYHFLMGRAVETIAKWENRPVLEVLHDLLLPPADVLRFAESGPVADSGNVPLKHGYNLFAGVRKALLAAACSVERPDVTFHPSLHATVAEDFLSGCRLGQTELGGYVVTVACPLGPVLSKHTCPDGQCVGRCVTGLLMRSLHRLAYALEIGDPDSALQPVVGEPLLTANLCEALLDLTPQGEDSRLTVSISWSGTIPPTTDAKLPQRIQFRREMFARIEQLSFRLRPAAAQLELYFGYVETLSGETNAYNRKEGQVMLRLVHPESETLSARAYLNADDYHIAWQAHGSNQPIRLRGILSREQDGYRITVSEFRMLEEPSP